MAPPPIELYFWPTPNGWKVSIMLEECGLPYNVVPVNIAQGEQFTPAFMAISPNNRMPAIVDPDGPGRAPVSVFESGAILQYLGRKTGRFYPQEERSRIAVEEWLYWQVANLGPMAGQAHHFRLHAPEPIGYAVDRYTDECNRLYGVMNKRLAERPYLAGDAYTIADIACISAGPRAGNARARTRPSSRTSSAGSRPCGRARRSSAECRSGSKRRAGSTCRTRKCARCCSISGHAKKRVLG